MMNYAAAANARFCREYPTACALMGAQAPAPVAPVAAMPPQWQSEQTGITERDMMQCVYDHEGRADDFACIVDASIFLDTCEKEEHLSESVCTKVEDKDIALATMFHR
jgi:hypothetical protein